MGSIDILTFSFFIFDSIDHFVSYVGSAMLTGSHYRSLGAQVKQLLPWLVRKELPLPLLATYPGDLSSFLARVFVTHCFSS